MIIREVKIEDYEAVYRLNRDSLGYNYSAAKTKERLEHILKCRDAKIFIACIDDQPVGYIHAENYECTFQDCRKNILSIAVAAEHQHKGIGSALIAAVETWAQETGSAGVRLVSGIDRTAAHAFYEARGYTFRKAQKNFFKLF